jgi:uncharacterized protein (DUF1697 family)
MRMTDLKACIEEAGLTDVVTYIQSGNVVFFAPNQAQPGLTAILENALSRRFSYDSRVVLVPHDRLRKTVERAPQGFGHDPGQYRYDVIFLRESLTAGEAMRSVSTKEFVDQAWAGDGVLYFARLIEKASQSHLSRIAQLPVYKNMTIRNWHTTTKLLALMNARASAA